jgi:hypothetical protein
MSKNGAARPANARGASVLVNFNGAITIAGVPMTALHGIAPDIAVTDRRLDVKIRVRARPDLLFAQPRHWHPALPVQRHCPECPPLQHSLRATPAVTMTAASFQRGILPGPDIAEGVPASSDFLGEGVDA